MNLNATVCRFLMQLLRQEFLLAEILSLWINTDGHVTTCCKMSGECGVDALHSTAKKMIQIKAVLLSHNTT